MNRRTALRTTLLACLTLLFVVAGCNESTPTPVSTPTPAEAAAPIQPAAAVTATIPSTATTTPSPAVTAELTATVTVTPTVAPVFLTLLETLNVRSGPGIAYPILGSAPADSTVTVIGKSPDDRWWKIECPPTLTAEQCWIVSDPEFSTTTNALDAVVMVTAPPAPSPTRTPTATPCVVSAPAGWSAYRVRSGDTLSGLAQRTGTSVATIQSVNCLETDMIVEGSALYVPGAAVIASAVGVPVESALQPRNPNQATLDLGHLNGLLAGALMFVNPGSGPCTPRLTDSQRSITIGTSTKAGPYWETGEVFGICLNGVSDSSVVTFTIRPPSGDAYQLSRAISGTLRWVVEPDDPRGMYTVTTVQEPTLLVNFIVTDTLSEARITVVNEVVAEGDSVSFVVAGYDQGPLPLFVCRRLAPPKNIVTECYYLEDVIIGETRAMRIFFSARGLTPGTYVIHDGNTDDFIDQGIRINDPRVFRIQ